MQEDQYTAIVADDHHDVRATMSRVLNRMEEITVVDNATDGKEAIELARALAPDLILMDIRMGHPDGLEATKTITRELPTTSVLILTSHEAPHYLKRAIANGAAGYLLKSTPAKEVRRVIRQVLDGESPYDPEMMRRALAALTTDDDDLPDQYHDNPSAPTDDERRAYASLTDQQRAVLYYAAKGMKNDQIASTLWLSTSTVKKYMGEVLAKLRVGNRAQASSLGVRLGLLEETH